MSGPSCCTIPGLPEDASAALLHVLAAHPKVEQVWLYGSRAMNRHRTGSDIDLSLEGAGLDHRDLLQLMGEVDDLLLAWRVDLSLRHQLPPELEGHLQRVGRPLLKAPPDRGDRNPDDQGEAQQQANPESTASR